MDPKENSNQLGNNVDDLVKSLLKSCEVSSLAEFYKKWLISNKNIVPVEKISNFHKGFSIARIKKDIEDYSDFLIISALDVENSNSFDKKLYIVNYIGLALIINKLKKKKVIEKSIPLIQLYDHFSIPSDLQDRFLNLLKRALNETFLYLKLIKTESGINLIFYNKLKHPTKRILLIELIATIIVGIIIIFTVFPIILNLI